jgi:hypothetical protein
LITLNEGNIFKLPFLKKKHTRFPMRLVDIVGQILCFRNHLMMEVYSVCVKYPIICSFRLSGIFIFYGAKWLNALNPITSFHFITVYVCFINMYLSTFMSDFLIIFSRLWNAFGIPKERPKRQNRKCCRLGFIKPVNGR